MGMVTPGGPQDQALAGLIEMPTTIGTQHPQVDNIHPMMDITLKKKATGPTVTVDESLDQRLSSARALPAGHLPPMGAHNHGVLVAAAFTPRAVLLPGLQAEAALGALIVVKVIALLVVKEASNGKYIWNRPISVSKTAPGAKLTMPSKALPPAQSLQKSSWTRSGSRSSIASTQASDSSPRPVALVSADAKQPAPLSIANDKENKDAVVKPADVEMAPPVLTTTPSVMKPIVVSAASVKSDRTQVSFAHPVSCPPEAKALQPPTVAKSQTTTVQSVPSPLLLDGSSTPQSQFEVANAVKAVPAAIELSSTVLMPETLPVSNIDGKQHLLASTPSSASRIATVASLADSSQKRHHDEHKAILSAVSLPTPVLTPQHTPGSERPSSPARPESLPTEAKSLRDALRIVAMTRLLCDRQTLEERIEPVLLNNQALAALAHQDEPSSTSQEIMKEVTGGQRHDQRMEKFNLIKGSLAERFKERQNALTKKVKLLKEEYLSLHERWLAHCAVLDEQNRPIAPEPEIVQPAGRTTRRTANLGDAVRSDLEMEQIIASLGNDDATDPNHLSLRNLATIPDMISVTRGSIDYTFDDTNHFIENPSDYYGPHTGIHDWTKSEKEIFLDKFAAHPKQFGMIAEHLPNKTAAQCVDYYYLHKKKHIDFRKVVSQYAPNKRKRGRTGKKKGNGLLADIRQHDAEIHGETGSPRSSGRPSRGRKPMLPPDAKEPKRASTSRRRNPLDLTPSVSATPTPEPETRRRGGRRSAAAPLSRTVSVSLDDNEEEATEEVSERPAKRAKRGSRRVIKSAATVVDDSSALDVKTVELAESISRRKPGGSSAQWSDEDKNLFLGLLAQHGDNFKRIAASMPNRTTIQVSNFFKANCDELGLEAVAASAPKRSLTPDATTDETRGPTPSGAATPATDIYDEPMASLTPDPPHANGAQKPLSEIESKTTFAWGPSAPRQATPPIPASHVQGGYYPLNGRGAPYYHPPHPMPATYGQPVPYPYAHYTAPRYSPYDPSQMPYAMPDPTHHTHMPIRSTDNPFPVLPQSGQATYPYSESS
ncbi:hypothetical protein H0H87_004368 [Tephrocybe sp. NHM501043]|nr:hypothetical protein H0H87_004368 [Tephrocybe sp. NHM501043]